MFKESVRHRLLPFDFVHLAQAEKDFAADLQLNLQLHNLTDSETSGGISSSSAEDFGLSLCQNGLLRPLSIKPQLQILPMKLPRNARLREDKSPKAKGEKGETETFKRGGAISP